MCLRPAALSNGITNGRQQIGVIVLSLSLCMGCCPPGCFPVIHSPMMYFVVTFHVMSFGSTHFTLIVACHVASYYLVLVS